MKAILDSGVPIMGICYGQQVLMHQLGGTVTLGDSGEFGHAVIEIGDACAQLIGQLLSDRISERLRAAQGVLALKDQYGAARLEAACERAIAHDSPHYRTVKTILAGGHDLAPVSTITPEPYAGRARFARATASLFEDDGPTFH